MQDTEDVNYLYIYIYDVCKLKIKRMSPECRKFALGISDGNNNSMECTMTLVVYRYFLIRLRAISFGYFYDVRET